MVAGMVNSYTVRNSPKQKIPVRTRCKESVTQNAKEIKAKTARLYELATELNAEVDSSDLTRVFPTSVTAISSSG